MDLEKAYCGSFKAWRKEDAKFKFAARVIAESICGSRYWLALLRAKCGTGPTNVRVIGCIIAEPFAECVCEAIPRSSIERGIVIEEFQNILQNPQRYLHPTCLAFLQRYLAGGCLGAYGDWVPKRCAWRKIWEVKKQEADLLNGILQECVISFFRDDSWEDCKHEELKIALQTWLHDGLPPNNGKLYLDPITNNEYSQMELEPIHANMNIMNRLVEAPTIVPFRCILHKLIVDVVGANDLVRLNEKHVPGTNAFHIHHRAVLEGDYGMKYNEQPRADPALLQHAGPTRCCGKSAYERDKCQSTQRHTEAFDLRLP